MQKRVPAPGAEVRPNDLPGGSIDQVPVIDTTRAAQIQLVNNGPPHVVCRGVLPHKNQQSQ
jgi:hypothetical protein